MRIKHIIAILGIVMSCMATAHTQQFPTISIQVLDIKSTGIKEIALSSADDGDYYSKFETDANFRPVSDKVPKFVINGGQFSKNIEKFSLEVLFTSGTTIQVPLRMMRPTTNVEKEIRLAGERVDTEKYAAALNSAIEILTPTIAYESYSVCKSYFPHAKDHPRFLINAAVCWVKANRYMVAATKPPYRRMFDADDQGIQEMRGIVEQIRKQKPWRDALKQSLYPSTTLQEIEDDLRLVGLSEWRLFNVKEIDALDKVYGGETTCSVYRDYREQFQALDTVSRATISSDSIGATKQSLERLMLDHAAFAKASRCSVVDGST